MGMTLSVISVTLKLLTRRAREMGREGGGGVLSL